MNVREMLDYSHRRLRDAGIQESLIESQHLVASALNRPRLRLLLDDDRLLTDQEEGLMSQWIAERTERKPLSYILGTQPFMELDLEVNPDVLIPRPETELLVERAREVLKSFSRAVVADVGTGSGNIALSLAPLSHVERLVGIDISSQALQIAKRNAHPYAWKSKIQWRQSDLLLSLPTDDRFHLIVANLPYVRSNELPDLAPELRWEPRLALDGGEDGLRLIRRLIGQAKNRLLLGGWLLLEIGADQGRAVASCLRADGLWQDICVYPDLAQHERIVVARRKEPSWTF